MLIVIVCSAFAFNVNAQTYAYKYSHSVKDGVKVPGTPRNEVTPKSWTGYKLSDLRKSSVLHRTLSI